MTIKQKFKKLSLCTSALCLCTTWGYGATEVSWTNLDTAMGNLKNFTLTAPSNITSGGVYLVDKDWAGSGDPTSATKIDTLYPYTLFVSGNWILSGSTAILTDGTQISSLNTALGNPTAGTAGTAFILYSSNYSSKTASHFAKLYWNGTQYQSVAPSGGGGGGGGGAQTETVSFKENLSTRNVDVYVNAANGATLDVSQYFNNATSYSTGSLPEGITFTSPNVLIPNTYTWTSNSLALSITANGADSSTARLDLNLNLSQSQPAEVTSKTIVDQTATVGTEMTSLTLSDYFTNVYTNTAYSIAPPINGLSVAAGGVLSGTPTVAADQQRITITATNPYAPTNQKTATKDFKLTVYAISPTRLTIAPVQTATVGTYFTLPLFTDVDSATYSITESNNKEISWLSVDANGMLSGTPTTAGTYSVTITATKTGAAQTATQTFTLTVYAISPAPKDTISAQTATVGATITPLTLSDYFTNVDSSTGYSITPTIDGLSINTAGELIGTPTTAAAAQSVTITATNPYAPTNQKTANQTFTLTVTSLIVSQAFGDPFQNLMTRLNAGSITDVTQLGFFHYTPTT